MIYFLLRKYYSKKPIILGLIYKFLFSNKDITIGKNFRCDTFPRIVVDKGAKVKINNNVIFRRNVEIRCHGSAYIEIGDSSRIDRGVRFLATNQSKIILNKKVRVGLYSVFNGGDSISIGECSLISGFVYIQTSMHNYKNDGVIQEQGYYHAPVSLGVDNWVGTHSVIFPGVTLGDFCIVGSNSVVNKSYENNIVIAGVPGKQIKERQ